MKKGDRYEVHGPDGGSEGEAELLRFLNDDIHGRPVWLVRLQDARTVYRVIEKTCKVVPVPTPEELAAETHEV